MNNRPFLFSFITTLISFSIVLLAYRIFYIPNKYFFYFEDNIAPIEWKTQIDTPGFKKSYKPQGLVYVDNHLFISNHWDDTGSRVYKLDIQDKYSIAGYFDMPKDATHTSGLGFDGKYLWAVDYKSNNVYKINPETSILEKKAQIVGKFNSGLKGLSACTFVKMDGRENPHLLYSDFRNSRTNYIIDQEQALKDGFVNDRHIIAAFKNAGFSQGLTWTGEFLLDSHGKIGIDAIYIIDLEKAIKAKTYSKAIERIIEAPSDMVEDMAFNKETSTLWTSDESTFKLYSTKILPEVLKPDTDTAVKNKAQYSLLFFKQILSETDFEILAGFWIVVFGMILFSILFPVLQMGKSHVGVYRPYEERLLTLNRLKLDDLLGYHSQYKWSNYSGMALGMVMLCVVLIITNRSSLSSLQITIQNIIVAVMSLAVIFLVFADLVHTNTQTPIIPIRTRFKLISLSVQLGTFGSFLLVYTVLLFVSMISLEIAIFSSMVLIFVVSYSYRVRRIPKKDFFKYFGIFNYKFWHKGDESNDPKYNIFKHDKIHIKEASKTSEEVFYQKLGEPRPIRVRIEEWIHDMMMYGYLKTGKKKEFNDFIKTHLELSSAANENRKQDLIKKLVTRLKIIQKRNPATDDEITVQLNKMEHFFNWDHKDFKKIKEQLIQEKEGVEPHKKM